MISLAKQEAHWVPPPPPPPLSEYKWSHLGHFPGEATQTPMLHWASDASETFVLWQTILCRASNPLQHLLLGALLSNHLQNLLLFNSFTHLVVNLLLTILLYSSFHVPPYYLWGMKFSGTTMMRLSPTSKYGRVFYPIWAIILIGRC